MTANSKHSFRGMFYAWLLSASVIVIISLLVAGLFTSPTSKSDNATNSEAMAYSTDFTSAGNAEGGIHFSLAD